MQVTKEATACGRTNHSPQSEEQNSERLGGIGAYQGERPPLAGGRTGAVDSSSPTHKGSINQAASSVRGAFGALPLRPTAMIRRTSHYHDTGVTASDGWTFRVDVVCVGADLRVRPWGILRFDEDKRTRRSAPTKGYTSQRVT